MLGGVDPDLTKSARVQLGNTTASPLFFLTLLLTCYVSSPAGIVFVLFCNENRIFLPKDTVWVDSL